MGKSSASCFKFIACGSDSVDHHDLQNPESKDQSDRSGWSFRKRSPRQRVLSNSATSEAPLSSLSANKESTDTSVVEFPVQSDTNEPEKTLLANGINDKSELPLQQDSKLSDTAAAKEDECGDANHDESSVIIIQAAIRGFLAQQVLSKQKKIIKMQAAVRGHIIRSYARGTLHCIHAIVKMQSLVRARQVNNDSILLAKKNVKHSGADTYISIEKLLGNAFARQLMESTPRPTNIKCEPSKSDTAWKWLERWMAVSSVTTDESVESGLPAEHHELNIEHRDENGSITILPKSYAEPADAGSGVVSPTEKVIPKNDGSLITDDANNSDLYSKLHGANQPNSSFDAPESDHVEIKGTNFVEEFEEKALPKEEINEHSGPDTKNPTLEKGETEARKVSRKASNPAFIAAQSKFEELSSGVAPLKLSSPSINDTTVESRDDVLDDKNTFSNASAVQIGNTEYGTQLSISSTLDWYRSEPAVNYTERETKFSEDANHHRSTESFDFEVAGMSMIPETHQSNTDSTKQDEGENVNPDTVEGCNSITTDSPQPEMKPETEASPRTHVTVPESLATPTSQVSVKPKKSKDEKTDSTKQEEGENVNPDTVEGRNSITTDSPQPEMKPETEDSPRTHVTIPESITTPTSQVSVKPKKSKGEKTGMALKNKSPSSDKITNCGQDAALRSSSDGHLPEHNSGKKRHSIVSEKPENESRDTTNTRSNNVPSYMQATESARAKAIANGSPRSSPDVLDKEVYQKKRDSLPISNDRQRSPRIQRPQQNGKGNLAHSPKERKWRR